jgi:hypothetical protein
VTGIVFGSGGFTIDPHLDAPRGATPKSKRRKARPVSETAVKDSVIKHIEVLGGKAIVKHQTGLSTRGTPDVLACLKGRFLALEIKRDGNVPTPAQVGEMRRWAQAGALVGWVLSVAHLEELLDHLDDPLWVNPLNHPGDGRSSDDPW